MRQIPIMKPYFTEREAALVAETLESGWVAQGPRVAAFEKQVAAHEGVAYGIAATSCTTALHLLMVAMGFGAGDDVLVPSFTFVATPNSVAYTGAAVVLVDVDPATFNLSVPWLESFLDANYREADDGFRNRRSGNRLAGIVPVNLFGLCADIPAVNRIAARYGMKVVEDSACALGAMISGTHEGGFGNPSALSFHPRKSITTGEGGMILTDSEELAGKLRRLRSHAASLSETQRHLAKGYLLPEFNELGYNYRMTDLQAAVGIAQMEKIDLITEARRRIAARYDQLIPGSVPWLIPPFVPDGYTHVYQTYCCRVNLAALEMKTVEAGNAFRNRVMEFLETNGIATRQGTHATHTLGVYRDRRGAGAPDLPGAYECDRLSIALPLYVELTEADQDFVIEELIRAGKEAL